MLAIELVEDRATKAPAAALAAATVAEARERGLLVLACGIYSNVIRILVPLVVADVDLERGLDALEDSLTSRQRAVGGGGPGTRAREGLTRAAGRRHRPSPVRELELPDGSPRRADRQSGGNGVHAGRVEAVRRCSPRPVPSRLSETRARAHAAEVAADACQRYDEIFVYGGDGVFNEAVNGMLPSVPIGFIPGGATSVLPRALGLPRDPLACARRLARSRDTRRISLGRVNGRHFTFCAGLGLDAEIVRLVDQRGRKNGKRPSDVAYVADMARIVGRPEGRRSRPPSVSKGMGAVRCSWPRTAIRTPSLDRCRFARRPSRSSSSASTSSGPGS